MCPSGRTGSLDSWVPGEGDRSSPPSAAAGIEAHWDEINQTGTARRARRPPGGAASALAGSAVADQLSEGQPAPATPRRPRATATTSQAAALLRNGVDDDEDGLVDDEDPDCDSAAKKPKRKRRSHVAGGGRASRPPSTTAGTAAASSKGAALGEGEVAPEAQDEGAAVENEAARRRQRRRRSRRRPQGAGGDRAGDQPLAEDGNGGSPFDLGGAPTGGNPTTTFAPFGPAPIGVPNFVIDSFEIPPFLLPIYQACGTEYGIPWEVLAAINKIETGFGTNLNVSSAGAVGWMQFLPSSWETFGLDANGDGRKDPYNPVDAICAAAHYLKIAGGAKHLYDAILAYNHADWYAQEVLLYARAYGRLPSDLVGSLTGLTEGAHFPVAADARYADDNAARATLSSSGGAGRDLGHRRRSDLLLADQARDQHLRRRRLAGGGGQRRRDPQARRVGRSWAGTSSSKTPTATATPTRSWARIVRDHRSIVMPSGKEKRLPVESENLRPRLRALPGRSGKPEPARPRARPGPSAKSAKGGSATPAPAADDGTLRVGSRVIAGTVLGRVGKAGEGVDPHLNFSIRPAGKGAPSIDPKPILDGWKLLEATAIYRAKGKNPFTARLSGAGVLLLSKEALQRRVLADKGLDIYQCGREDIASGKIDRRVLAVLEYLRVEGLPPHGHGAGVRPRLPHHLRQRLRAQQRRRRRHRRDRRRAGARPPGPGHADRRADPRRAAAAGDDAPPPGDLAREPARPTSFALADHDDHVHIGYRPAGANPFEAAVSPLLKPEQWQRLIQRLGEIENPDVPIKPSKYSEPDSKRERSLLFGDK